MKEIIIHAGLHRTGSTSIQQSLISNKPYLKKHGYQYMDFKYINGREMRNHSNAIVNLFGDKPGKHRLNIKNNWDDKVVYDNYNQQLKKALTKIGNNKLIISSEVISLLNEEELSRLLEYFKGCKIRIIIFIREPYEALCSRLQLKVRIGTNFSFNEYSFESLQDFAASNIIKKFKSVFQGTEFYSFNECLLSSGPVIEFINLIGLKDVDGFSEHRKNESCSNKLIRLGQYINRFEPYTINGKYNPNRVGFFLKNLEFSNDKFFLTHEEAKRFEDYIYSERKEIQELTGIQFNSDVIFSENIPFTRNEIETLIEKSAGINPWIKNLIWDYIKSNPVATDEYKKRLFLSDVEFLDADVLKATALLWEKKDLNKAYHFMKMAHSKRPEGIVINKKLDEYRRKLKISESD